MKHAKRAAVALILFTLVSAAVWYGRDVQNDIRRGNAAQPSVAAGDEFFAVDPNMVTEVLFRTADRTLSARRPDGSGSEFLIEVNEGSAVEQCSAGPAFTKVLQQLSSIRIRRVVSESEARELRRNRAGEFADLQIVDATALDPAQYKLLLTSAPGVILADGDAMYETMLSAEVVLRLRSGCPALASDTGGGRRHDGDGGRTPQ